MYLADRWCYCHPLRIKRRLRVCLKWSSSRSRAVTTSFILRYWRPSPDGFWCNWFMYGYSQRYNFFGAVDTFGSQHLLSFSGRAVCKVEVSNPKLGILSQLSTMDWICWHHPFLWKNDMVKKLILHYQYKAPKLRIVTCFFFWGYCKYSGCTQSGYQFHLWFWLRVY